MPHRSALLTFLALQSMTEFSTPPARDTQTTLPVTIITQDSTLTPNEFSFCLRALLRPSSALSPCEFAPCMRALIPSPVPAGAIQHSSNLWESALHASRTIRRFLPDNVPDIATRAAEPVHNRIFRWYFDCISPTASSVSPACPLTILLQLQLLWLCRLSCSCDSSELNQRVHQLPSEVADSTANTPRWV